MMPSPQILAFYATPAPITAPGRYAKLVDELPNDPEALNRAVPGVVIHEYLADHYGAPVPNERKAESHLRPVEALLARIAALDPAPLSDARPPAKRLVGVCRHFEVLLTTFLRAKRIPARVRRGFGTYFDTRMAVDHELTEYWSEPRSRWVRVDAKCCPGMYGAACRSRTTRSAPMSLRSSIISRRHARPGRRIR